MPAKKATTHTSATANTARRPNAFSSTGTMIRKPLPKIDASGVTVVATSVRRFVMWLQPTSDNRVASEFRACRCLGRETALEQLATGTRQQ